MMCTTTGTGEAAIRGFRGQELGAPEHLDQAQGAGYGGDQDQGDQAERHPPRWTGWGGSPWGRSPGAGRVEL